VVGVVRVSGLVGGGLFVCVLMMLRVSGLMSRLVFVCVFRVMVVCSFH
jgi:hypothetical protein